MPNNRVANIAGLAALTLLGFAPAALAQDELSGFYGNTMIAKDGDYESHYHYNSDHTFSVSLPAYFMVLKGTWSQEANGQICRVFASPLPGIKNPDCNMMQVHKVGDTQSAPNGDSERLVSGVQ